jgi:hypothetical protein
MNRAQGLFDARHFLVQGGLVAFFGLQDFQVDGFPVQLAALQFGELGFDLSELGLVSIQVAGEPGQVLAQAVFELLQSGRNAVDVVSQGGRAAEFLPERRETLHLPREPLQVLGQGGQHGIDAGR